MTEMKKHGSIRFGMSWIIKCRGTVRNYSQESEKDPRETLEEQMIRRWVAEPVECEEADVSVPSYMSGTCMQ